MAGIYIHIPFCKQKCSYCDFHFSTKFDYISKMIISIKREMEIQKDFFRKGLKIETIYFGGGTPSLLETEQINELLKTIKNFFNVIEKVEITIEINPDDINENKLEAYKSMGINRLSVGVQSFIDKHLKILKRIHNVKSVEETLKLIKKSGFNNFSIDIIFGIPDMGINDLKINLDKLNEYEVPHFSAYNLTVEDGTILKRQIEKKEIKMLEDEIIIEQFKYIMNFAEKNGYKQYEISNYAQKDYESKHNSLYWKDELYLGLGPSAHSFDGFRRYSNVKNNNIYMDNMDKNILINTEEKLSEKERLNEFYMLKLRQAEGVDLDIIIKKFGGEETKRFINFVEKQKKYFNSEGRRYFLNIEGKCIVDNITLQLIK